MGFILLSNTHQRSVQKRLSFWWFVVSFLKICETQSLFECFGLFQHVSAQWAKSLCVQCINNWLQVWIYWLVILLTPVEMSASRSLFSKMLFHVWLRHSYPLFFVFCLSFINKEKFDTTFVKEIYTQVPCFLLYICPCLPI